MAAVIIACRLLEGQTSHGEIAAGDHGLPREPEFVAHANQPVVKCQMLKGDRVRP